MSNALTWKHDEKIVGDWDVVLGLKANAYTLDANSVRTIDAKTKESTVDTQLSTSVGTKVALKSVIGENLTWNDAHVAIDGSAVFVAKQDPLK